MTKSTQIITTLSLLGIAILAGCQRELETDTKDKEEIVITDFNSLRNNAANSPKSVKVDPKSNEAKIIYNWIEKNRDGWHSSSATFVNGCVWEIDGDKFNLLENEIVVETKDGDQITHDLRDTTIYVVHSLF